MTWIGLTGPLPRDPTTGALQISLPSPITTPLTLNAKDQQNYTETGIADSRPVIRDLNYVAAPPSAPGGAIDYHGIDLLLSAANANVTSSVGLYPFESEALYSGPGTIGRLVAAYLRADMTGAGTVAGDLTPLQVRGTNTGGGTVAAYRGIYVRTPDNTGSTMTLLRGLYLEDMTAAGGTVGTAHAIYSDGGQSYHKGPLGIGPIAGAIPAAQLHIRAQAASSIGLKLQAAASQSADLVNFVDNADTTRLLTVDKDGKLGIGVSTVLAKVHLKGASAADDTIFVEESASATKRVVVRSDGSVGLGLNYPTQSLTGAKLEVEFNGAGIQRTVALNNSHAAANGDGTQIEGRMGGNQWGLIQCVMDTSSPSNSSWRFKVRDSAFTMVERFRVDGVGVGFFGVTPVAKPTLAAAATDLASVITLANDLRTRLINYGLGA